MKKISNWLHQIVKGWVALAAFLAFLLFTAFVLPDQAAKAEVYSGEVGSPDSSFFYTADRLYQFAESYGANGRQMYIRARWTFDVLWPLVYTAFLTTSISWLTQKARPDNALFQRMNLLPVSAMVLDFLENAATSIVMARFPQKTPILAHLAGFFTTLKWLLIAASFLVLFIVLLFALWKFLKPSKHSSE